MLRYVQRTKFASKVRIRKDAFRNKRHTESRRYVPQQGVVMIDYQDGEIVPELFPEV